MTQAMRIEDLHPDFQATFKRSQIPYLKNPVVRHLVQFASGLARRPKSDPEVSRRVVKLKNCRIRVYEPKGDKSGAGLLWIHGGGMVLGSAAMNDAECNTFVKTHKAVVVSVDYRLAPAHRFPAAIDDCFEAWQWMLANAEALSVAPSNIIISGQSAGGGLAAALCQRIYDFGGQQPNAQVLIYPMLDDRTSEAVENDPVAHIGWNNRNNRVGWRSYLGEDPDARQSLPSWAAPGRREDAKGLPACWMGVGTLDLFLEENRAYALLLKSASVPCEYVEVERAPHGFEILVPDSDISKKFTRSMNDYMAHRFAQSDP